MEINQEKYEEDSKYCMETNQMFCMLCPIHQNCEILKIRDNNGQLKDQTLLLPQIKKSFPEHILISREVFNWMTSIIYLFFDKQTLDVRKAGMKKLKEVEEEVEKK